jgi:hypothetical protein
VSEFAVETSIPNRVMLETLSGGDWQPHKAMIANLTRNEVWIRIEESLGELLYPESKVRLVLRHPNGGVQTAESMVLWHIGLEGLVVVLMRPTIWDPPSRRAHSRTRLTIPIYLHSDGDAPPVPAMTTNLGVGGVHCLAEAPVPEGHQLRVSLQLTPGRSFDCQGEVVRVESNTDDSSGRQVVLALRFVDMSQNDQAELASALAEIADDVDEDSVPRAWRTKESAAE